MLAGSMAAERVYFTWPDRRFRYDCRGCGACCKGLGIGIDVVAGQLVQLVRKRPELAAFVRRRGDAVTAFNPRDRCWFLADDGLCRVEIEDGRAAKPASCRLFPFNRVFRAGSFTIVDYNSVICPLAVVGDDGVTHAEVLAEIATIQDPAIVGTQLPPDDALFERELAIADEMFARAAGLASTGIVDAKSLEREPGGAIAADSSVSAPIAADASVSAALAADSSVSAPIAADASVSAAFELVIGMAWRLPGPATLSNALMVTPSLRFNELYGPRQYAPRDRMSPLLARMWLGWLGFAALGEQLAQRSLGLQELTTLWSEQASLMHAFARWDAAPVFKPGPVELPSVDPGNLVRTIGQRCVDNRKAKRPLGELVEKCFEGADPATRVAALKLAEPILRASFAS